MRWIILFLLVSTPALAQARDPALVAAVQACVGHILKPVHGQINAQRYETNFQAQCSKVEALLALDSANRDTTAPSALTDAETKDAATIDTYLRKVPNAK